MKEIDKLLAKYKDGWVNKDEFDAPPNLAYKPTWMWDTTPDEELLEMGRELCRGSVWCNNGIVNKRFKGTIPEGWERGRLCECY